MPSSRLLRFLHSIRRQRVRCACSSVPLLVNYSCDLQIAIDWMLQSDISFCRSSGLMAETRGCNDGGLHAVCGIQNNARTVNNGQTGVTGQSTVPTGIAQWLLMHAMQNLSFCAARRGGVILGRWPRSTSTTLRKRKTRYFYWP